MYFDILFLVTYLYRFFIMMSLYIYVGILAPTNVRAEALTSHSIEVRWDESSSPDVTGYIITFATNDDLRTTGESVTVNGHSNTSGILSNLEKGTSYTITVQATASDNRMSGKSSEVLVATHTDGA